MAAGPRGPKLPKGQGVSEGGTSGGDHPGPPRTARLAQRKPTPRSGLGDSPANWPVKPTNPRPDAKPDRRARQCTSAQMAEVANVRVPACAQGRQTPPQSTTRRANPARRAPGAVNLTRVKSRSTAGRARRRNHGGPTGRPQTAPRTASLSARAGNADIPTTTTDFPARRGATLGTLGAPRRGR